MRYGTGLLALALAWTALVAAPTAAYAAGGCQAITHRAMFKATENQVRGVEIANRWGWAEVDARVTVDGVVVAVHDYNMSRLSGGASNAKIHETTFEDLVDLPYVFGKRIYTTQRLIRVAAKKDRPIMVTINSWGHVKDTEYADQVLDTLWDAAQAHPHPKRVFFGGQGSRRAMLDRHPKARTFYRYSARDNVKEHALENEVDMVSIPPKKFKRRTVRKLNRAGLIVTSTQLSKKDTVRRANRAGIRIIQVNKARKAVRRWCT